jgi:hypothetical protein
MLRLCGAFAPFALGLAGCSWGLGDYEVCGAACGDDAAVDATIDAPVRDDASLDATTDTGTDAVADGPIDATTDVTHDVSTPPDAPPDAPPEAAVDAPIDAPSPPSTASCGGIQCELPCCLLGDGAASCVTEGSSCPVGATLVTCSDHAFCAARDAGQCCFSRTAEWPIFVCQGSAPTCEPICDHDAHDAAVCSGGGQCHSIQAGAPEVCGSP